VNVALPHIDNPRAGPGSVCNRPFDYLVSPPARAHRRGGPPPPAGAAARTPNARVRISELAHCGEPPEAFPSFRTGGLHVRSRAGQPRRALDQHGIDPYVELKSAHPHFSPSNGLHSHSNSRVGATRGTISQHPLSHALSQPPSRASRRTARRKIMHATWSLLRRDGDGVRGMTLKSVAIV